MVTPFITHTLKWKLFVLQLEEKAEKLWFESLSTITNNNSVCVCVCVWVRERERESQLMKRALGPVCDLSKWKCLDTYHLKCFKKYANFCILFDSQIIGIYVYIQQATKDWRTEIYAVAASFKWFRVKCLEWTQMYIWIDSSLSIYLSIYLAS